MVLTLFSPILLFLFLIHAMVGYVELGTDSWIQNITNTVLKNKTLALVAFIWTNVLMFTLAILRRADRPQDLAGRPAVRQRRARHRGAVHAGHADDQHAPCCGWWP